MSFLGLQTEFPIIICNLATGTDAIIGRYRPYRGQNSDRPIQVEGSSSGVKFQPGDDCSEPIHRSGNDNSGDCHTIRGRQYSTTTGCDQNTTSPFTRSGRPDMRGPGFYTETPAGGSLVGIFRYISGTGSHSHRSHGCGGARHQYGRPATHPLCTMPHVTPEDEKEEECVAEMLTGGQIEASDSPWSSPVVLVMKKDGGTQFCADYRQLNDAITKDAYPLPRIDDTLDMLAGKQWFSTLDLASGYWQVSLSQEARVKTAFATHSGLFQFRVMPFGLRNAPVTFERLMDRALQGLWWSRCLVYLDDIISFGSTFDGALANLTLIFERLRSYRLQLKSTKCHLFRSSVPFLGHIVARHGLECDPTKIEDVKSWPVPDCLKSVRQFLGFVGYYRRFIPRFADVATPLVSLTGKDVPFVWDSSCLTAFGALRAALIDAPILAFPTETGLYVLDTDVSYFGLGGVLSQIQNDQERLVAYCSRALLHY